MCALQVGGNDGAGRFTRSEDFAALKVGVALDEGLASPTDAFTVFFGERAAWFFSGATPACRCCQRQGTPT